MHQDHSILTKLWASILPSTGFRQNWGMYLIYTLSDTQQSTKLIRKNGPGLSSVSLDTVSAVTVLTVTADCVRYIQNAECPDSTLHCDLEQHLVHNTCSSAAALTGQVLLKVAVKCNLPTTSIEKTYREDTEYRSAASVLVPSNKSLQLCHRRSSTQHLSAASVIMQSSVVGGEDHFSSVKAQCSAVMVLQKLYLFSH